MNTFDEMVNEAIKETLDEYGTSLSDELINEIRLTVEGCYENRSLMTGPVSNPLFSEIEKLKQQYKKEMQEKDHIENVYRNNVALRHNVSPHDVYIEGGSVMYRPN